MQLKQQIIPRAKWAIKCPFSMRPEFITVHNTYNDAPAKNEIAYMTRNNLRISFHVAVDDVEAIQAIPFNRTAWHAGDGFYGTGNRKSIGVEICYSKSGGARFIKAEKNGAKVVARLLKQFGLSIGQVKPHQYWSGKYCPHRTLDMGWSRFLAMVQKELGQAVTVVQPTAKKPEELVIDGWIGTATIIRLQQKLKTSIVDGYISSQYTKNKKYLPAATSGWYWVDKPKGSPTIRALQQLVGAKTDGIAGKKTVIALQKYLNKRGFHLKVDGYLGRATGRAVQRWLNG